MRTGVAATFGLLLVALIVFFGACAGGQELPPPVITSTTTSTTTTTTSPTSTTPIDPAVLGTLPPITGLGPPTLDRSSTISTVGIDRVTFGMTVEAAQWAAGTQFTPVTPRGECFLATPDDAPTGLTFWIVDSTVERVDVDTPAITTRSGFGLGDTEEQIFAKWPDRIRAEPMADGSGNLLVYVPEDVSDRQFRVIFQTDGKQVIRFWSGRLPWAGWLHGCTQLGQ